MQLARPAFASSPLSFGRGRPRAVAAPLAQRAAVSDDLKLFGTTFLVGFVFVSVLIA